MLDSLRNAIAAWQGRRSALRELQGMDHVETVTVALDDANPLNRAKVSLSVGDKDAALHFFREAQRNHPGLVAKSHDVVDMMIELGLLDEAEAFMRECQKRNPRDSYYAAGYALVAQNRGDYQEAMRRWRRVRRRFPNNWMGFVSGAICAREAGNSNAAERLLARAVRRFPKRVEAWIERARNAEMRSDWPEAIRRWEPVLTEFNSYAADLGVSQALWRLGRLDDAEDRLKTAVTRFPLDDVLWIALARLQYQRDDKAGAARTWGELRRRFPKAVIGYEEGMNLFREMANYEELETVATEAVRRLPDAAWSWIAYASSAGYRSDWEEAAKRWESVRERFPDHPDGYQRGADAFVALGREEEAMRLRAHPSGGV